MWPWDSLGKTLVLTELWDAAPHPVTSAVGGVRSWGCFAELGCIFCIFAKPFASTVSLWNLLHLPYLCETFCTTCRQYPDKDDFMLYNSQLVIYSYIYSRGWPWCCVWRASPPAHRLQRPPDKSRDMNKGQGSLPWATKAVLENKNSTERAHKRQKILPSCQLLSRPCLQRRGVQGQAIPWAKELQQRAHQHVPGRGLPLQPRRALPWMLPHCAGTQWRRTPRWHWMSYNANICGTVSLPGDGEEAINSW